MIGSNRLNGVGFACALGLTVCASSVRADLVTDPNDPRTWQGAGVGTFAQLYYGSDTPANRQLVVDNQLLDDGVFDSAGYSPATLVANAWSNSGPSFIGQSFDLTGTGSYDYGAAGVDIFTAANSVDNLWFQSSGTIGDTVYDLGFDAQFAAIFAAVDHGPIPQETIESTVYLSNDLVNWEQATVRRVNLEGYQSNTGILWDGFVYTVRTNSSDSFRYASIIHGGPGALINDGDDEISAVMGVPFVPAPGTAAIIALGGIVSLRRRR